MSELVEDRGAAGSDDEVRGEDGCGRREEGGVEGGEGGAESAGTPEVVAVWERKGRQRGERARTRELGLTRWADVWLRYLQERSDERKFSLNALPKKSSSSSAW